MAMGFDSQTDLHSTLVSIILHECFSFSLNRWMKAWRYTSNTHTHTLSPALSVCVGSDRQVRSPPYPEHTFQGPTAHLDSATWARPSQAPGKYAFAPMELNVHHDITL